MTQVRVTLMTFTAPGTWNSPITPELLAQAGTSRAFTQVFRDQLFWDERRPTEGGRNVVVSKDRGDILPAPWSASTRVHEMGGLSWLVTFWNGEPGLMFCEASDQRLYWKTDGGTPLPLTPASPTGSLHRYAEMHVRGDNVICIREITEGHHTTRSIISINIDGSITTLDDDSHFYAHLAISPDGNKLAWVGWEHPQMPWDGTQIFVAEFTADSLLAHRQKIVGSTTESVNSPTWDGNGALYYISDTSNWWNVWHTDLKGNTRHVAVDESEWAKPLWIIGWNALTILPNGHLLAERGPVGHRTLTILDPATGSWRDIDANDRISWEHMSLSATTIYALGQGKRSQVELVAIDLDTLTLNIVVNNPLPVPSEYFSPSQALLSPSQGGRTVHSFYYPAHNPEHTSTEPMPVIITCHGGPTANVEGVASLKHAYFTSRGFAVVDVNYGGSTGYGRKYRDTLLGQWGVVDTEDVLAVADDLVTRGLTTPDMLFIRGGSAGGFAVLNALVHSDKFAGGANYYGVADLTGLMAATHDFEAHYTDSLVAPYPEGKDLYIERSPLTHAANVSSPIIFFQGLDDEIVPPAQSEAFRDACIVNNIKYKYFEFEGEAHGFRKAATIITAAREELAFFTEILNEKTNS